MNKEKTDAEKAYELNKELVEWCLQSYENVPEPVKDADGYYTSEIDGYTIRIKPRPEFKPLISGNLRDYMKPVGIEFFEQKKPKSE